MVYLHGNFTFTYAKPMRLNTSTAVKNDYIHVFDNDDAYAAFVSPSNIEAGEEYIDSYNKICNSPLAKALS